MKLAGPSCQGRGEEAEARRRWRQGAARRPWAGSLTWETAARRESGERRAGSRRAGSQGPWRLGQVAALPSEPSRASATCGLLVFILFLFSCCSFWCWESSKQGSQAAWMHPAGQTQAPLTPCPIGSHPGAGDQPLPPLSCSLLLTHGGAFCVPAGRAGAWQPPNTPAGSALLGWRRQKGQSTAGRSGVKLQAHWAAPEAASSQLQGMPRCSGNRILLSLVNPSQVLPARCPG